jgi:hypothetical protein
VTLLAGGDVTFDYLLDSDQSQQNKSVDLLVARTGIDQDATSGAATFVFQHALSAVTFSGANTNATDSELTYIVSEVTITDIKANGTFTYPLTTEGTDPLASAWDVTTGAAANFKAGIPASGVALVAGGSTALPANLLSGNERMMVIPQEVTVGTLTTEGVPNDDGSYVTVKYSLKDGSGEFVVEDGIRTMKLPDGFEFKAGTRYNFAFSFATTMVGPDALVDITFTASVVGWTDSPETLN